MHLLPVMEYFYTIQGEGFHQGKAAYFIRLAGCDVGCVWCDVKESWDASKHPHISINHLVSEAKKYPSRLLVITGGEPLMHDLTALTDAFHKEDFQIHLETSGAYPLTGSFDWICFSPKKFKKPLPETAEYAHELKAIIYNASDFKWAEENRKLVPDRCKLFLQPEWTKRESMTPEIIEYVKEHPEWEISLQIHKYMQVP